MHCKKCGAHTFKNVSYCPSCGEKVAETKSYKNDLEKNREDNLKEDILSAVEIAAVIALCICIFCATSFGASLIAAIKSVLLLTCWLGAIIILYKASTYLLSIKNSGWKCVFAIASFSVGTVGVVSVNDFFVRISALKYYAWIRIIFIYLLSLIFSFFIIFCAKKKKKRPNGYERVRK